VVAAVGERGVDPGALGEARPHALGEVLDLRAGVVVVELAAHLPPLPGEQRRDRVA
jgi:hypothetical protein